MSVPIISVAELKKRYLIGHQPEHSQRYKTLRDVFAHRLTGACRRTLDVVRGRQLVHGDVIEEFWALQGISFDVEEGSVVGIIGSNGAGKSTLLKVLSRITEPTAGQVRLRGRVASLLEVGTGFHPELTGRENIFLNGAILGMSRKEVKRKFDQIVSFAEVQQFLDVPVKRYSSGMYVRLAFAVAAHLDPEILVVDEVLAVGDISFQRKCLGKMHDVASEGRTVLLVSHNMPMIKAFCDRTVVLSQGKLLHDGGVESGIQAYLSHQGSSCADLKQREDRKGDGTVRFTHARVESDALHNTVQMGAAFRLVLGYGAEEPVNSCDISIHVNDVWGQPVLRLSTRDQATPFKLRRGLGTIVCNVDRMQLLPGRYSLLIAASRPPAFEYLDYVTDAVTFEVTPADVFGTGRIPEFGIFYCQCDWSADDRGTKRTAIEGAHAP